MSGQITLRHRPDTEELAARREEFAELLTKLSERELDVSTLREDLAALEVRYVRDVGSLYEQLDAIHKRIFELRTLINPSLAEEQEQCGDQAQGGCGGSAAPPSGELKSLYRNAAPRLHPDLAERPEEQERRTRFMAEANRAYQAGDAEALQRILEDFHYADGREPGSTTGAELLRVMEQLRDGRERLAALDREQERLRSTEIFRLRQELADAEAQGRDMLGDIAKTIRGQIQRAERILASVEGRFPNEIPLPPRQRVGRFYGNE